MSIISEQINAIKYVGKFLHDLRFGPKRRKHAEMAERIRHLMRHYPSDAELETMWRGWLLKGKGHE